MNDVMRDLYVSDVGIIMWFLKIISLIAIHVSLQHQSSTCFTYKAS